MALYTIQQQGAVAKLGEETAQDDVHRPALESSRTGKTFRFGNHKKEPDVLAKGNHQNPGAINPQDVATPSSKTIFDASQTSSTEVVNNSLPMKALSGTRAELLRLRSNYEWIASGHQRQVGLDHPNYLTEELNSRRVENKLIERCRRNRVRSAVENMAAVLPQQSVRGKRKRSDIASTIENATEYIQALQDELAALKRAK